MTAAALVGALLVLFAAYWQAIRANDGGRHRLEPDHPGWETAIEDLYALQRARGRR